MIARLYVYSAWSFPPCPDDCAFGHFNVQVVIESFDNSLSLQQDFTDLIELALDFRYDAEPTEVFIGQLQSRTFFGTISRFLRCSLSLDDYRRLDEEGNFVVSTVYLHNLLKGTWTPAESNVSLEGLQAMLQITWNCVDRIAQFSELRVEPIPLLLLASKLKVSA